MKYAILSYRGQRWCVECPAVLRNVEITGIGVGAPRMVTSRHDTPGEAWEAYHRAKAAEIAVCDACGNLVRNHYAGLPCDHPYWQTKASGETIQKRDAYNASMLGARRE